MTEFELHIEHYPSAAIYDPQMSLKYALPANGCNEPRYGPANQRFGENCKKIGTKWSKFGQNFVKNGQNVIKNGKIGIRNGQNLIDTQMHFFI